MLDWLKFPNTIQATKKSLQDIKNTSFVFQLVTALVSTGYFIYALIVETGLLWANALSLSLIIVFNIIRFTTKDIPEKKADKKVLHTAYRWTQIVIRAFTLAVMLYGVYAATSDSSENSTFALTIIYASVMVTMWIVQLILEIVIDLIGSKLEYISQEFQKDMDPIMHDHIEPVMTKVNYVIETKEKIVSKAEEFGVKTYEAVESITKPIVGFAESIKKRFGACALNDKEIDALDDDPLSLNEPSQTSDNGDKE